MNRLAPRFLTRVGLFLARAITSSRAGDKGGQDTVIQPWVSQPGSTGSYFFQMNNPNGSGTFRGLQVVTVEPFASRLVVRERETCVGSRVFFDGGRCPDK